ncbi:MAG: GAF domain-containing protein [Anaerolineae bacterium]|nr:GAF domain-containing protein [Anaerolineae bacterium]
MSVNKPPDKPVSDQDIANNRQNLGILRGQVQTGRIDGQYLLQQIESVEKLLGRLDAERKQGRKQGRFEALYNVSRAIGSSLDLQTVLDQVMDAIIHLTGAERGFLMLRNDDGGLEVKAARNLDQQTISSDKFLYSRTITNQVVDSGIPLSTINAAEDPRFAQQASIVNQVLRSIMATPLRARGNVIGVVYVDSRVMAGLFNEDDLAALEAFAGQAAVAIDNARLFSETDEQLSQRVEELQLLRRVDLQLNETLDSNKAMQDTLDWACRLAGATSGHFGLTEGDPPRVRAVCHYGEGASSSSFLDTTYPEVKKVMATNKPIILSPRDTLGDAVAIVPVHREANVLGVVVVRRAGAAFSAEQQDLIERMMARAAAAIENAQLYAKVQAADRAKSEFVGIVAHDLKVPMTSIAGYADLTVMQGNLSDRQREFLQRIKDTVKRMEMLVSDLSDISRIESGHFFMDVTRVKVSDLIQAVKDGTMTQIEVFNHHYIEETEPNLPDMQVDYYRLLQVLTNLVSNAYKYTPEGGTIWLRARRSGGRIEFSVQDTGIGLSPEAVAKMGTKFWRAEDDFTRSRPGTGLGFAITRSLVEQMGDKIQIQSQPGQGSTFTFSVPAVKE